jgi:murein DD-endopeptidase MepM/ murein hydrolase activator NlpD
MTATTKREILSRLKAVKRFRPVLCCLMLASLPLLILSCRGSSHSSPRSSLVPPSAPDNINAFDDFLETDIPPADGFDFAVGNKAGKGAYRDSVTGKTYGGWYIATNFAQTYQLGIHTGEDWNGNGGGNTDLGQEVFAVANGRIAFAKQYGEPWGNVVVIDHVFYENNEKKRIRSVYAHLQSIKVQTGQGVGRRQLIGTVGQDPEKLFDAHLHLELRWDETLEPTYWPSTNGKDTTWIKEHYTAPTSFITNHRTLPVPQNESTLVLIDQDRYQMRVYRKQKLLGEYQVGFGQGVGPKRVEGDKKTPVGMYFVIQKHKGKFDGDYAPYYGGYWMKINYPNRFDASRGRAGGLLTLQQEEAIARQWEQRAPTLESTRLGGGIGFHGWIKEWDNAGPRHMSFGCVVMHLYDISKLYEEVDEGAMVVIF